MRWVIVAVLCIACSHDRPPAQPIATTTPDPWAAPASPTTADDPPGITEVHTLAEKACPRVARPYFYRVERAGRVSYFLGTRHIGVPLSKFPPHVGRELRAARLVVFETPPDNDNDAVTFEDPAHRSLSAQLGPELWARYRALVGSVTADALEHARPSAAMIMLISLYEDKLAMLDVEIEQLVRNANIPTAGLETHQFQDQLIQELMDIRMLRASLKGTSDRAALAKESRDDLAEYCAGTDEQPGTDPENRKELRAGGYSDADIDRLDDKLVYARNRDWIPKLEPLLDKGGVVVVVGADHLIGKRGVIALLAGRGWKTTRVTQP
jgi:uncharacterized protein YbaP (TraB family)